jgi:hypothetical protein
MTAIALDNPVQVLTSGQAFECSRDLSAGVFECGTSATYTNSAYHVLSKVIVLVSLSAAQFRDELGHQYTSPRIINRILGGVFPTPRPVCALLAFPRAKESAHTVKTSWSCDGSREEALSVKGISARPQRESVFVSSSKIRSASLIRRSPLFDVIDYLKYFINFGNVTIIT